MADRDIPEEMVRAGAIALNGGHERYAMDRWESEVRCVLSAALAGRQVVDEPLREELIGCHHPAWPDPLNFDYGDGPQVNARRWLAENRDQHPQIVVRRRLVSDWTVWDDSAAGSGSGEGAAPGPVHPDGATEGHFQPSPGRVSGMTDPIDELAVRVLNEHLLAGPRPGQCRCGWGDGSDVRTLGRSHSKHVVEQLRAVGALTGSGSGEADVQPEPQHLTDPQRLTVRPTWEDPS